MTGDAAQERMRLFVGVDLPGPTRAAAARVVEELRGRLPAARWVPVANLHVTMAFLGETDLGVRVREALDGAIPGLAEFGSRLMDVGAFPSAGRARVLWIGLEDQGGQLSGLARAAQQALQPLGFAPEARGFSPHLTIARFKQPAALRGVEDRRCDPAPFRVDRVTLFRSRLGRPAPTYERLAVFPLSGDRDRRGG